MDEREEARKLQDCFSFNLKKNNFILILEKSFLFLIHSF